MGDLAAEPAILDGGRGGERGGRVDDLDRHLRLGRTKAEMDKRQPPVHIGNLFILSQLQYPLIALALPPIIVLSLSYVAIATALTYSTGGDFSPLTRAGAVIVTVAFLYVLAEEVWKLTPRRLILEIEGSFSFAKLDEREESQIALQRFRAMTNRMVRWHRPVARSVEAFLIVLGGVLSGFGDLIGPYIFAGT
ncbi:hypothetical protein GRZ55_14120 [Chelativorans sp. ZYF759]|uniref:hypothetical protein n=1 Tax=Chelativorans sp. ZYF759 TaxID=2692213 RepID=UPI00145E4B32|nr:hypothetical protein [Chelativorans sp. ZYF759]NMG40380.1 hypothetical protein [Chelativorans sp. ZYF759]